MSSAGTPATIARASMDELRRLQHMQREIDAMRESQAIEARIRRDNEDRALGLRAFRATQLAGWRMARAATLVNGVRGERKSIDAWVSYVDERARKRDAAARAASCFRHAGLARAARSWHHYAEERKASLERKRAAVATWVKQGERHALNVLNAAAAERRNFRAAASMFVRQSEARCLNSWKGLIEARREQKAMLHNALVTLHPRERSLTRAWNAWHAEELKLAKVSTERAAGAFKQMEGHRALVTWKQYAAEVAASCTNVRKAATLFYRLGEARAWRRMAAASKLWRKLKIACSKMERRHMLAALNGWTHTIGLWKEKVRRVRLACAAFRERWARRAINQWHHSAADHSRRPIERALAQWTLQSLLAVMVELKHEARTSRLLHGAVHTLRSRVLRSAWNSMAGHALSKSRLRKHAAAAFDPRTRRQRRAVACWAIYAAEATKARAPMLALYKRGLRAAFNTWGAGSLERRAALERAQRSLGAFRSSGRYKAFLTWKEQSADITHRHGRMRGMLRAWRQRGLSKCYRSWADLAAQREQMRKAASTILKRSRRAAWNSWRAAWNAARAALDEAERVQARQRSALKALSPLGRAQRKALNSWKQLAHMRRAMHAVAMSLKHRGLRSCFNSWAERTQAAAAAYATARRVAGSIRHASIRRAYNAWTHRCASMASAAHAMGRVVGSLRNVGLRKAWGAWVERATWNTAKLAAARRVMGSLRNQSLRRAANMWIENHQATRTAMEALHRAAARWSRRGVSRALMQLSEVADARRQAKRRATGVARSLRYRGCRGALNSWRGLARARSAQRRRMTRAVRGLTAEGRTTVRVMNTWREQAKAFRSFRAAAVTLRKQGVRKTFNTWSERSAERADALALMRKTAGSFRSIGMRRAFNAWQERSAGASTRLGLMRGTVAKLLRQDANRSLRKWASVAANAALLRRALRALINRAVRTALNHWLDWGISRAAALDSARRAMRALRSIGLRRALNGWTEHATLARDERARKALTARRWRMQHEARAFSVFRGQYEAYQRLKATAHSLRNVGAHHAFNKWSEVTEERSAARQTALHALRALDLEWRQMRKAFNSLAEQGALRRKLITAAGVLRSPVLARAFRALRAEVRRHKRIVKAAGTLMLTGTRRGFYQWIRWRSSRGSMKSDARMRGMSKALAHTNRHGKLMEAFSAFGAYHYEARRLRGGVRIQALYHLRIFWRAWRRRSRAAPAAKAWRQRERTRDGALTTARAACDELKTELDQKRAECRELRKAKDAAERDAEALRRDGVGLALDKVAFEAELEKLRPESRRLRHDKKAAEIEVAALRLEAERLHDEASRRSDSERKRLGAVDDELSTLKKEATRLRRAAADARTQHEHQRVELLAAQQEIRRLKAHISKIGYHPRATEASRGWRVPESPDWAATPHSTPQRSRATSPVPGGGGGALSPSRLPPHWGEGFRSILATSPPRARPWVPPASPLSRPMPTEGLASPS